MTAAALVSVSLLSALELPNSLLAGAMMGRPRAAALQACIDEHLPQVRIDLTAAALVSVSLESLVLRARSRRERQRAL